MPPLYSADVRPAGNFDYETGGSGYSLRRRGDPRIGVRVAAALGPARTVVNVGAGAGSYEPGELRVTAVEPSATMRSQRRRGLPPAIDAVAEHLPFADGSFDAAMAMITIHHWSDPERGLRELARVSRGRVVVLTFDRDALGDFWLARYAPELIAAERRRFPDIGGVCALLGKGATVASVPVPFDCTDGFTEAFYGRPERFLEADVRAAQSAWGFVPAGVEQRAIDRLRADLESGRWDERHGHLRHQPTYSGSLRLVVSDTAT